MESQFTVVRTVAGEQSPEMESFDFGSETPQKQKPEPTKWQKFINAIGDTIGSVLAKIIGILVDKELKWLFIALAVAVIITGLVVSITWTIQNWKITLPEFLLFFVWRVLKKVRVAYRKDIKQNPNKIF